MPYLLLLLLFLPLTAPAEPFHAKFPRAQVGIYVVERDLPEALNAVNNVKPLYAHNEDSFFIPASVLKVVTAFGAMHTLGEEFTFHTDLAYEGTIGTDGTLHGNLWIRAGGDPTLSLEIIEEWERALRNHFIRAIDGKVIIDASCYETAMASPYWLFEDLGNYYGAGPSGLTIHHNLYHITFKPGSQIGDPAQVIQIDPPIPGLIYHNEVTTAAAGTGDRVVVFGSEYSPLHYYRGTIPIDQPTFSIKAAIPDPPLFCAQLLTQKLRPSQGFQIIREKIPTPTLHPIQSYASPSLKEIANRMLNASDNLYAQHLLKALGHGHADQGAHHLESLLLSKGIPAKIKDGAGLARLNLLTPKGLVDLLTSEPLFDTLPTLTPTLHAKSGTMSGIHNLSGYLRTPTKELIFAIFINHHTSTPTAIRIQITEFLMELSNSSQTKQ